MVVCKDDADNHPLSTTLFTFKSYTRITMSPNPDPVRDLNNYLQSHPSGNLTHLLSWAMAHDGPQNQVTHYATANFQHHPIGSGRGLSKGNAKAAAAIQALQYLYQYYPY